jgi:hypothetical protein
MYSGYACLTCCEFIDVRFTDNRLSCLCGSFFVVKYQQNFTFSKLDLILDYEPTLDENTIIVEPLHSLEAYDFLNFCRYFSLLKKYIVKVKFDKFDITVFPDSNIDNLMDDYIWSMQNV